MPVTIVMTDYPSNMHHHTHNAHAFLREVRHTCKQRGLRLTPIRDGVLELIAHETTPVKAYDLLDKFQQTHGSTAPPTIYRALDFLLENNFIHKLSSINAYIFCPHPSQYHQVPFLICDQCNRAIEICDEEVAKLVEKQSAQLGFAPHKQVLEIHGICAQCQAQTKA